MKNLLITGASGLIAGVAARKLCGVYNIIAMGRTEPEKTGGARGSHYVFLRGDFTRPGDLAKLDGYQIDLVLHLGAVTGGCSERDGMLVNVEGSRCLLAYALGRGCRRFVFASSIAAVGMQRPDFVPEKLPLGADHGCYDIHGYGFSKYLMEEMTRYYARKHPDLDVLNIRLASVPAEPGSVPGIMDNYPMWGLGMTTVLHLDDGVDLFSRALAKPHSPGAAVINGVASRAWLMCPTAEQARNWWGSKVDSSFYEGPENRFASFYDWRPAAELLGFRAEKTLAIIDEARGG